MTMSVFFVKNSNRQRNKFASKMQYYEHQIAYAMWQTICILSVGNTINLQKHEKQ